MAEATLRHGEPMSVDYTPAAGALTAGQVVLTGNTAGWTLGIARKDIPNSTLGALACFGGVWDVINLNNAANYAKVWWDDANNKVTTVSTNNALFGFIVEGGAGGANSTAGAFLNPFV